MASDQLSSYVTHLEENVRASYKLVEAPEKGKGLPIGNGSWTGIIGMVLRNEAEMLACPTSIDYERNDVVDFGHVLKQNEILIVYKRPSVQPNVLACWMPFSAEVWYVTLLFLAMMVLVTIFFKKCMVGGRTDEHLKISSDFQERNFPMNYDWPYKELVLQPCDYMPGGTAGRILVGVWILLCLQLSFVYTGNLRALLIMPKITIPFDDISQLVTQSRLPWVFAAGSQFDFLVKAIYEDDPESSLGKAYINRQKVENVSSAVIPSLVLDQNMAVFRRRSSVETLMSQDFTETGICHYALASKEVMKFDYGLVFRHGSPLLKMANDFARRLTESGIGPVIFQNDINKKSLECFLPPGHDSLEERRRAMVVTDFIGAFVILFTGWSISLLAFIGEQIRWKGRKRAGKDYEKNLQETVSETAGNALHQTTPTDFGKGTSSLGNLQTSSIRAKPLNGTI